VKNYSQHSNIHGIDAYSIVKTLLHLGLISEHGNLGRAAAYKVCSRPLDPPKSTEDEPQKAAPKKEPRKSASKKSKAD
jgi:chromosome segregation and condensation protein ScpB